MSQVLEPSPVMPTSADDLAISIARLIEQSMPGTYDVRVTALQPLFGGNARKAWSFDLRYESGDQPQQLQCVMLSQLGGRQVESDVAQEFGVLHGLNGHGLRVPRALAVDETGAIVGAPSIVLERLPGKASAVDFLNTKDLAGAQRLTVDLAAVVAQLHSVACPAAAFDPQRTGATPLELAARQVAHWETTFEAQRMEPLPVMASLFAWLRHNLPEPQRISLVHGDLRPGNFLYEGDRVAGLLDWEMAHPGDPLEDIGWIYRPMWSPAAFVPLRNFVALYSRLAGVEVGWADVLYYRIFSELKFATISLTAARAFSGGSTRNLRHADRAATVGPCLQRCIEWIKLHREESCCVQTDRR